MIGIDSTVPEWNCENLEASSYTELMRAFYRDVDIDLVEKAYGYNACSVVLANSPLKVTLENNAPKVKLPPGWPSQNYRVYFDEGVYPYRLDTGCFLTIRTVNAAYVKFIYGSMYGDHDVISKVYDAAGNFVTDKVGLDLVEIEPGAGTNYHIKSIKPFNATRKFKNGDTITALIYSQEGHLLGHTPLVVAESNMLRSQNAPIDYITSITLDSPYLSESDSNMLLLPLNWNKNSMNIEGVVNYSSGRKVKLPIDTRKFTLRGLGQLISSIPNQEYDMVLHYKLDVGEASIVENHIHNNGISWNVNEGTVSCH